VTIRIDATDISNWFNAVRMINESEKNKLLDAFWDTQLSSKSWLIENLYNHINKPSNIYIFGGWVGTLASMLLQQKFFIKRVFSIDIDHWCQQYANIICKPYAGTKFESITADMAMYEYDSNYPPDVVINTSTEHVSQETYDSWYDNIPKNTLVVVQGNNFFECDQHIRCSENIENFLTLNKCNDVLFQGELNNPMYTRYMSIFYQN
jgi:hypothetical protein